VCIDPRASGNFVEIIRTWRTRDRFLACCLTGFTVVALPLVGALAYSAWNTERLAEQSRTAVFSASQAARASRSLVNRIGSIERLAQQLAGVEDPALAADYAGVHRSFRQIADEPAAPAAR